MAHDTRTCEWPDCSEPITGRKHYCEPHRIEAVRESIRQYRLSLIPEQIGYELMEHNERLRKLLA